MMRKILFLTVVFGTLSMSTSCNNDDGKKDPLSDCNSRIAKYADLMNAKYIKYFNDETVESCIEYKKAIEEYVKNTKGCPGAATETYTELANTLDCK